MICQGFTRPDCKPCENTEDLEKIKVEIVGETEKKALCLLCRSRLLTLTEAWNLDDVV